MASSRKGGPDLNDRLADALGARPPGRLCVAYSGGLDSTVLLHLLADLSQQEGLALSAAHVHHGLSPRADAWAAHCQAVCAGLGVPLSVEKVRVTPAGEGVEAAARAARHAVFAGLDTDVLALAQHQDDQAETVLHQLLRGGGPRGLAAMPVLRHLPGSGVKIWRPLLSFSRSELEAWARTRSLTWVEDESNRDTRYSRNALRHAVLPRLAAEFPGAAATLARAAGRFAEAADLLDVLADFDLAALGDQAAVPSGRKHHPTRPPWGPSRSWDGPANDLRGLGLAALAALGEVRGRNVLRRFLEVRGGEIHGDALREALRQLLQAREDARVAVDFGPLRLCRHQGQAWAVPVKPPANPGPRLWQGESRLDLGALGGLCFHPARGEGLRLLPGAVTVDFRRGGEMMRPGRQRPRRPLKELFREAGIPPWLRASLPLLRVEDRLAWAAGVGPDADFLVEADQPGWLISWDRPW